MEENNFKDYSCSYIYKGKEWGIILKAESEKDAFQRMRAIGLTGSVFGELIAEIPANPITSIFVKTLTATRNFFHNLKG